MKALEDLAPPTLSGVSIDIKPPDAVALSGTITTRDPAEVLEPFLRDLHAWVIEAGLREFYVDVSSLTFVNSSAIRLFVDWATWVKTEPTERRYSLNFLTDKQITWQRTSFMALQSLAGEVVSVTSGGGI